MTDELITLLLLFVVNRKTPMLTEKMFCFSFFETRMIINSIT